MSLKLLLLLSALLSALSGAGSAGRVAAAPVAVSQSVARAEAGAWQAATPLPARFGCAAWPLIASVLHLAAPVSFAHAPTLSLFADRRRE